MHELLSILMLAVLVPAVLILLEIIWERIEDLRIKRIEKEDEVM